MRSILSLSRQRLSLLCLLLATLSLVACGGSSTDNSNDDSVLETEVVSPETSNDLANPGDQENPGDQSETIDDDPEPAEPNTDEEPGEGQTDDNVEVPDQSSSSTTVTFDITVPAYQSDALQVVLSWGPLSTSARWVTDESWMITQAFPSGTEHPLEIMFLDDNGVVTLGSFETTFRANGNATQHVQITADQFDTMNWDDDADGISNIDELITDNETDPSDANPEPQDNELADLTGPLSPVTANVELIADKTFRISWRRSAAADYYRVLENPDGVSGYSYISDQLDASTDTFDHRVPLHKRVNARYMVEACNTDGCTLSVQQLIEVIDPTLIPAVGYFKASTFGQGKFGSAVSMSADGNTMAVGAPADASSAVGINGSEEEDDEAHSGAVYVFARNNGTWQQLAYIKASNTQFGDNFGASLSLSADGQTLAVGAFGEDSAATGINGDQSDNTATGSGAVYVFNRRGDNWSQQAYIKASNTDPDSIGFTDKFGANLALSANGNTLVVGATGEDSASTGINGEQTNNDSFYVGAVYVFERQNGTWEQQAYVKPNDPESRFFGQSIGLSADGNTMAVGVNDYLTTGPNGATGRGADATYYYGAVYVFIRQGSEWEFQAFLRPDSDWSDFGDELSLAADGNTLAISGTYVVYLFERAGTNWQQQAVVEASNDGDRFGQSLSLSGDGSTLAVGAYWENGASSGLQGHQGFETEQGLSGAAYVFTRADGTWPQITYIKASNNVMESIQFGISLSLDQTGDTLAIGANQEGSTATGINGDQNYDEFARSGAVYLY